MINELFSKRTANLEEIISSDNDLTQKEILNSKNFQINLINDLINNKRNIVSWEVYEKTGSIEDIETTDDNTFNIAYTFNFKYDYNGMIVPMTLFISGDIDINWKGSRVSATYLQPEENPKPEIDNKNLGKMLDLGLFDNDGNEINLTWLTVELKTKVVKSIISPYL